MTMRADSGVCLPRRLAWDIDWAARGTAGTASSEVPSGGLSSGALTAMRASLPLPGIVGKEGSCSPWVARQIPGGLDRRSEKRSGWKPAGAGQSGGQANGVTHPGPSLRRSRVELLPYRRSVRICCRAVVVRGLSTAALTSPDSGRVKSGRKGLTFRQFKSSRCPMRDKTHGPEGVMVRWQWDLEQKGGADCERASGHIERHLHRNAPRPLLWTGGLGPAPIPGSRPVGVDGDGLGICQRCQSLRRGRRRLATTA